MLSFEREFFQEVWHALVWNILLGWQLVLEQFEAFLDFISLPRRDAIKIRTRHLENGLEFRIGQMALEKKENKKNYDYQFDKKNEFRLQQYELTNTSSWQRSTSTGSL